MSDWGKEVSFRLEKKGCCVLDQESGQVDVRSTLRLQGSTCYVSWRRCRLCGKKSHSFSGGFKSQSAPDLGKKKKKNSHTRTTNSFYFLGYQWFIAPRNVPKV